MISVYDIALAWIFFCGLMAVEGVTVGVLLYNKKFVWALVSVLVTVGIVKYFIM
jgi:hypothetical protein